MNYYDYIETLDVTKRKIDNLIELYQIYPANEQLGDFSKDLVTELYQKTVKILDMKKEEEGPLTKDEQAIYDNCRKALDSDSANGLLRITINTIESIASAFTSIYHILPWGQAERKIQQLLFKEGEQILPGYISFLSSLVDTYETYLTPDLLMMPTKMYEAAGIGEKKYRTKKEDVNKAFASMMLKFADYAYSGKNAYDTYVPLKKEDLPPEAQPFYNSENGIFAPGHGLKVWLAKNRNANEIVVAYSGTDITNWNMLYADFQQINTGSALYLEAAGFLRIMSQRFPNAAFLVSGHSLGGGLAQFSVTANINAIENRVKCYAFNPAGLSMKSLNDLKEDRLMKAKEHISVYVTAKDVVSMTGAKLGNLIMLPSTESNGHGIKSLYRCMEAYLAGNLKNALVEDKLLLFDVLLFDSKKLPGWKTVGFSTDDGTANYSIFETAPTYAAVLKKVNYYLAVMVNIAHEDGDTSSRFGIYEYFNGDAFTVINRLLIFQEGDDKPLMFTKESAASCIFFGPYGYGKRQWFQQMLAALEHSNSPITRNNLDVYFSRIKNEYTMMLDALLYLLKNMYGYDFYDYFERYSVARDRACQLFMVYDAESTALYDLYDFNRPLFKEGYTQYINKKYDLFSEFLKDCGTMAVKYGMMSQSAADSIRSDILKYLAMFIKELTQ